MVDHYLLSKTFVSTDWICFAYKIIFIDTLYLYSLLTVMSGIVAICVWSLHLLSLILLFAIQWLIKYLYICVIVCFSIFVFVYLRCAMCIEYCACSPWRLLSCSLPFTDWGQAWDEMLVGGLFICLIVNGLYLLIQYCQNDNQNLLS